MKISELFSKSQSVSRRRTRSATPASMVRKVNKFESINWENLLEQENSKIPIEFIPAPIAESDKNEYTTQLNFLKTQFNRTKIQWTSIETALNKTKIELTKIENSEKDTINRLKFLESRQNDLNNQQLMIKKDYQFALVDYNSYLHTKERMNITMVFLDIKANNLRQQLRIRNEVCKEEERKMFKIVEGNGRTVRKLRNFSLNLVSDDKKRGLITRQLDREIIGKQNFASKREEIQRRRVEIVEAVANEDKNQRNNFLREGMLLHQAWFKYLNTKLQKETQQFRYIEKAYANIRSLTGLSDIHEVVQKILTKEQSYSSLMNMIKESKKVCDKYQERNYELEREMNDIIVRDKGLDIDAPEKSQSIIIKLLKKISRDKEKLKKLDSIKSFVGNWVKCMIKNINPTEIIENNSLQISFGNLRSMINSKIKSFTPTKITKIEYESYSNLHHKIRKQITNIDYLKISDLIGTEDEISESHSPSDKLYKRKMTKKYT